MCEMIQLLFDKLVSRFIEYFINATHRVAIQDIKEGSVLCHIITI